MRAVRNPEAAAAAAAAIAGAAGETWPESSVDAAKADETVKAEEPAETTTTTAMEIAQ